MIDRSDLKAALDLLVIVAPAPLGALIGLRYAKEQSRQASAVTWICSCGLAAFAAPMVAQYVPLTDHGVALVTIVIAATGMEVMAGLVAASRAFAADPFGVVGKVFDLMGQAASVFRRRPPGGDQSPGGGQ